MRHNCGKLRTSVCPLYAWPGHVVESRSRTTHGSCLEEQSRLVPRTANSHDGVLQQVHHVQRDALLVRLCRCLTLARLGGCSMNLTRR
jgi:hypothetical protein